MRVVLTLLVIFWGLPQAAAGTARVDPLCKAIALSDIVAIMREEGVAYGDEIASDLFPGRGGQRWAAMVGRIYDVERMERTLRRRLSEDLADTDLEPLLDFFGSDRGQRIIGFEVAARRALLDENVDAASRERLERMIRDDDPLLAELRAFAAANELIDLNVVGALNANYAFYMGLADGGAFPDLLTEDEILADVWSQEAEVRHETEVWLYSYLALAYQPLETGDLEAYIAFSRTEGGQTLNRALFAGFDEVFVAISGALGRAAAGFIGGEEL